MAVNDPKILRIDLSYLRFDLDQIQVKCFFLV
jgi:hypothetical protein